uniref:Uncharacterized protein n=1 Tax=viral metagenome TaxID=1070528 RepID=A0A6H1ZND2_9ZZZZ
MNYSGVNLEFRNGDLCKAVLHDPTTVGLTDCRKGFPSFVTVNIGHNSMMLSAYLPPELAQELGEKLMALFEELDGEQSLQVDFPAAVDPVAAMERGE